MKALNTNKKHGFTLIEMVGVLAVIAILAALLVPKVMAAISDSKYSSTVSSINNAKTAVMSYYAKNTSFSADTNFDTTLLNGGFIDQALALKVGTGAKLQVTAVAGTTLGGTAGTGGYKLDGTTQAISATTASYVVECVIKSVPIADAIELSTRMDGATMTAPNATTADDKGRVTYDPAVPGSGLTDVYIYLTSK